MAPELATLLEETAVRPATAVDPSALVARVRRRRLVRRAAGTVACMVLALVVAVPPLRGPAVELAPAAPAAPGPVDEPGQADQATAPSQSPEDAARDGVVPVIAALPLGERLDVVERHPAAEGTWVTSRLGAVVRERAREDAGAIGAFDDPRALDGRDALLVEDYGELLLLDAGETRILRAYPLPYLPPQALAVSDGAVHCARQGDGGLPDSMLCRVDRTTLAAQVRVFPADGSGFARGTNRWTPTWWTVEPPGTWPAVFAELVVEPGTLRLAGPDGTAEADPETLALRRP